MTTLTTRTEQPDGPGRWGLLGATALTLLIVGASAIVLARPHDSTPPAGERAARTSASASDGAQPRGGQEIRQLGRLNAGAILYLVDSEDDAAAIQALIAEDVRGGTVIVIDSPAVAARIWPAITAAEAANAELGLPPLEVVDRRRPGATGTPYQPSSRPAPGDNGGNIIGGPC